MAVIRENQEYVKADLLNFVVQSGELIISLRFYKDKSHREYEKKYENDIKEFHLKVSNYLESLQNEINAILKTICPDAVSSQDFEKFSKEIESNEELQNKSKYLSEFADEYSKILDILEGKSQEEINEEQLQVFESFGLNQDWLKNPIIIVREGYVNIGSIEGKVLNGQNIYTMLKEVMPNTVDDI